MKKAFLSVACMAALLGVQQHANAAESIFDFSTGATYGFAGNGATASSGIVPAGFSTSGQSALDIANKASQTYGGALTATVPADLINAPSFTVTVTLPSEVEDAAGVPQYFDLVPVYFSTDGEIDPDTAIASDFVNLGASPANTYTFTVTQNFHDPDGVLASDATPGEILTADNAFDATQTPSTIDAITGFQLTVEHGSDGTPLSPATVLYVDSLTVPSAATPEPTSIAGLLLGGGALIARRRKA